MPRIFRKIQNSFQKNRAEAISLLTGKMPNFVYGIKNFKDIPVFCFHSAQYPLFEYQLQFLNKNGYKTLTADELYERCIDKRYKNSGKEIALTFDDGMASVWTVAYPLLEKYEHKIIIFILPGLTKEGRKAGATIDDATDEEAKIDLSNRDYSDSPLCNWNEIEIMHRSGLVDFQSHGMSHTLISTSPAIVDFIHPGFDVFHYGNIHIPVYLDFDGNDSREKILGHPVYQHAPRLSGKARYFDPIELRQACAAFVEKNGGESFFKIKNWRSKLAEVAKAHHINFNKQQYESPEQVAAEAVKEIKTSRMEIENRLNKKVSHFCFPWFVGSHLSVETLSEFGYLSAHMGVINGFIKRSSSKYPVLINRVQQEYLQALPGQESKSLLKVFISKIHR